MFVWNPEKGCFQHNSGKEKYYCNKCRGCHYFDSKKGKEYKKFGKFPDFPFRKGETIYKTPIKGRD